eukprot:4934466-Amphidinium_carterae.1
MGAVSTKGLFKMSLYSKELAFMIGLARREGCFYVLKGSVFIKRRPYKGTIFRCNKRALDVLIEIPSHVPEGEGTEEEGEDFTSSSDSNSGTQCEQEVTTDGRMKPDTQVAVHLRT